MVKRLSSKPIKTMSDVFTSPHVPLESASRPLMGFGELNDND